MEHTRNDAFDDLLDALDATIDAFVDGRPDAFLAWWTRSEDVSLAGGRGGPITRGRSAVRARLQRVSAMYGDTPYDTSFSSERVHACAGRDVAYVVQHERFRFSMRAGASPTPASEAPPGQVYGATMTFRREDGGWRVAHRHADRVSPDRSA